MRVSHSTDQMTVIFVEILNCRQKNGYSSYNTDETGIITYSMYKRVGIKNINYIYNFYLCSVSEKCCTLFLYKMQVTTKYTIRIISPYYVPCSLHKIKWHQISITILFMPSFYNSTYARKNH